MLDHLREHQEVIPYLYSKIPPSFEYLPFLLRFMYNNMSMKSFAPLLMASFPHDVWMALWEAYGDPCVPPFPENILHLVTPNELRPPHAHVANLVPAIDALDLME